MILWSFCEEGLRAVFIRCPAFIYICGLLRGVLSAFQASALWSDTGHV